MFCLNTTHRSLPCTSQAWWHNFIKLLQPKQATWLDNRQHTKFIYIWNLKVVLLSRHSLGDYNRTFEPVIHTMYAQIIWIVWIFVWIRALKNWRSIVMLRWTSFQLIEFQTIGGHRDVSIPLGDICVWMRLTKIPMCTFSHKSMFSTCVNLEWLCSRLHI